MLVSTATELIAPKVEEIASKAGLFMPFDVRVTVKVQSPFVCQLQRTGVNKPLLLVAHDFVLPIFHPMSESRRKEWQRDFKARMLRVLKETQALSRRSCLVTGDLALAMRNDRMAMRRAAIIHDVPLHPRYFSTTVCATVRCEISGRERVVKATPETISHAIESAKAELSHLLLLDNEDAELVDLLEGMRSGVKQHVPSEVIVKEIENGTQTIIRYEDSLT